MAIVVKNNMPAKSTLNEMNRNSSALSKTLKQASTGMRINGAQDDASGFSIAEKMRAKLRGLEQDVENVKTGRSMLGVAAGGIESIVEELRNLKEIALNAANDHNSDLDRATLQKEFRQKTANIDDIASTMNYNGKLLLDGTYRRWQLVPYQPLEPNDPATVIPMGNYTISVGGVYEIPPGYSGTITIASGVQDVKIRQQTSGQLSEVYIDGPASGSANLWIENLNIRNIDQDVPVIQFYGSGNYLSSKGSNTLQKGNEAGTPSPITNYDKAVIHVGDGLTLSGSGTLTAKNRGWGTGPVIGADEFEMSTANIAVVSGTYDLSVKTHSPNQGNGACIGSGYFGTIGNIIIYGGKIVASSSEGAGIGADWQGTGTGDILIGNKAHIISTATTGAAIGSGELGTAGNITISKQSSISAHSQQGEDIGKGLNGTIGNVRYVDDLGLEDLSDYIETELVHGRPLVIHHGTRAGEAVNFYINDMHSWSLGIDETTVITRDDATAAISAVEDALEYALEEATYIGSYTSRLEYTEENLVTANENTRSSESTIRDADMARTMLDYAKSNILSQASQSMLAQANQNLNGVLSLLQ